MTSDASAVGLSRLETRRFFLPLFYLLCAGLVVALYVGISYAQNGAFGFPLDDAWIHQVYARNLGTRFEFAFFAGQPSAGSTSPLWAIVLAMGYALHIDYRLWAIALGIVLLAASGWAAGRMARGLTDTARLSRWVVPVFLIGEWHMVWAAASGMEILLFVFLALLLVTLFWEEAPAFAVGIVAGLLVLTRPEGIVLAGLVGVGMVVQQLTRAKEEGQRLRAVLIYGIGLLIVVAPYVGFNLQTSGTILPNTFYAKAAEYATLTNDSNFFVRWVMLYRQPLIGAQLLLLPGLVYGVWRLARERVWLGLIPALWILLLPALYAWRLPVEYQFGRYEMPILPFVVVYGIWGTAQLFQKIPSRVVRQVWAITIGVLLVAFLGLGANLYAQSVAVINCEMVATAEWTRTNIPSDAPVAVHDIGAEEYLDPRPLLDMAGLVSPEVIPFIRDEAKLNEWMRARGAQYAIFFADWYPNLATQADLREVHSTGCGTTRALGEENLRVYRVR